MRRALTITTSLLLLLAVGTVTLLATTLYVLKRAPHITPTALEVEEFKLYRVGGGYRLVMTVTNYGDKPAGIVFITVNGGNGEFLVFGDNGTMDGLQGYTDTLAENITVSAPSSFWDIVKWLEQLYHPRIILGPGTTVKVVEFHQTPGNFTLHPPVGVTITYVDSKGRVKMKVLTTEVITLEENENPPLPPPPPPPPWQGGTVNIVLKVTITRLVPLPTGAAVVGIPLNASVVPELFQNLSLVHTLRVTMGGFDLTYNVTYISNDTVYITVLMPDPTYFYTHTNATIYINVTGTASDEVAGEYLGLARIDRIENTTVSIVTRVTEFTLYDTYISGRARIGTATANTLPAYYGRTFPAHGVRIGYWHTGENFQTIFYFTTDDGSQYKMKLAGCLRQNPEVIVWKYENGSWVEVARKEMGCTSPKFVAVADADYPALKANYTFIVPSPIVFMRIEPYNGYGSTMTTKLYIYDPTPAFDPTIQSYTVLLFQDYYLGVKVERVW